MGQYWSFTQLFKEKNSYKDNIRSNGLRWKTECSRLQTVRWVPTIPTVRAQARWNRNNVWQSQRKTHSRKWSPVRRPWSLSCWFIVKRIKSPGRCLRFAPRKSQEMNGNSITKHVWPGIFPAVFRRTELGFFLSFPALSPYLYSYSFLTSLLH